MNNIHIKGDEGKVVLENIRYIKNHFDNILTTSDKIIIDNLIEETKTLLNSISDNSKTDAEKHEIFYRLNKAWFDIWKQYKDDPSAIEILRSIDDVTNFLTAYSDLFHSLSQINEGRTGEYRQDFKRIVAGFLLLAEVIDVFVELFSDSELQQIYAFTKNAMSMSVRDVTEYFKDPEVSNLTTQLRAYSSLIILKIEARIEPVNLATEISPSPDPWIQSLMGSIKLGANEATSESWLDKLAGSISDEDAFQEALAYGRIFRQTGKLEDTIVSES